MSHNAWVTNTDEIRRERRHASSRARWRQPLFFSAAQARKLTLSGSLGWAEGTVTCHPRNSDGGAAIEVLSVSSVFWGYPSVLVLFGIYVVAVVTAVLLLCVTHAESVPVPAPVSVRAIKRGARVMLVAKAGHHLQQGRATNFYLAHQQHQDQHQHHHQQHLVAQQLLP